MIDVRSILKVPRSVWPKGSFRISAVWDDKHITGIERAGASLGEDDPTRRVFASTIDLLKIDHLVNIALTTEDFYLATAAMDRLFDAYDSFQEIVDNFLRAAEGLNKKRRKRVAACLCYLLGLPRVTNRRPILNKPATEVALDAAYFMGLSKVASEAIAVLDEKLYASLNKGTA